MVKRIDFGNDVLPPTAAGQIPIAQTNGNNRLVYGHTSTSLPIPQAADVGKVIAVNTVTANAVTYKYETLTPIDPLLLTIYNQSGVLWPQPDTNIANRLHFTFSNKVLTCVATNNLVVFYNPATETRTTKALNNTPITITSTTAEATFVYMNSDGTFGQQAVGSFAPIPSDTETKTYLCKAYHPGGGNIVSVKPIYNLLSHPQDNLRVFGLSLGLQADGFLFVYGQANGNVAQTSQYAVVSGYNINPSDSLPSQRVVPTTTQITFQYWSWHAADRLPSKNSLIGTYKVDNPAAGTSTAMAAGQFGIVVLFIGSDGSYILLAPQKAYPNLADAQTDLVNYVSSVALPQLLIEQYKSVAAIIISDTVSASTTTVTIVTLNSLALGGDSGKETLPAPTTAGVVKVLPGSNAYSIETDTPTPAVNLTGFVNGDILGVTAGVIAPVKSDLIFPVVPFVDAKRGSFRTDNAGTTISHISADLTAAGLTITGSVSGSGDGVNISFLGSTKFWLHGGFCETAFTQQHFLPRIIFNTGNYFNGLFFIPIDPRTFSDNTTGFNFVIFYYLK